MINCNCRNQIQTLLQSADTAATCHSAATVYQFATRKKQSPAEWSFISCCMSELWALRHQNLDWSRHAKSYDVQQKPMRDHNTILSKQLAVSKSVNSTICTQVSVSNLHWPDPPRREYASLSTLITWLGLVESRLNAQTDLRQSLHVNVKSYTRSCKDNGICRRDYECGRTLEALKTILGLIPQNCAAPLYQGTLCPIKRHYIGPLKHTYLELW